MASPSRRLERFLFILMALTAHLPAVLLHNHCSSNFNVTFDMEVIIAEGGTACLFCDYSGTRLRPEWYRGTSVITDGNTMDPCDCAVSETDSQELCFESITNMAVGEDYSCQILVGVGQVDTCSFSVKLAVRPNIIPPIANAIYNITLDSISPTNLTIPLAINSGIPPATVQWTKDGRVISRETTLTVANIDAEDRGVYRVNVSNIAGYVTRDFSVYVQFLNVEVTSPVQNGNGMYTVQCGISGYPQLNFERWTTVRGEEVLGPNTETTRGTFEDRVTSTLTVTQADCVNSDGYTCVASTRNGGRESSSSTSGCSAMSEIRVTVLGSTSVRVEWDPPTMPLAEFIIEYRLVPNGPVIRRPISNTETSLIIEGLMAGSEYEFHGIIDQNSDGIRVVVSLQACSAEAVLSVATNVRANTNVIRNERTISVSWDSSSSVANYRLYIKVSNGTETSITVSGNTTTYVLPPQIYLCSNNLVYTFIVQGLNECMQGGRNSTSVNVTCSAHERLATISSITTYSTAITIHWTTMNNRLPRTPLSLTALQIKVIDGEQYKLNYTAMNIITGAFCMGELEKDTLYEVCLHPTFNVNGMVETESVCMFAMTRAVDNENVVSILDQCAKPVKRTSQVSFPSPAAFPDYAIAVIVVGVLGMIALIFCFIGLCFACHSSKQKEVDFGSTSSLQPPSEPMHNHHRSMSPSRSCLSYHTKGHSTNWSDHVDTLRQMETDTGTHV